MNNTACTLLNIYRNIEVDVASILKAQYDLTLSEYLILHFIVQEKETSITNIKGYMDYPTNKVTTRMKKLYGMRLIMKERKNDDERIVTVYATEEGKALVQSVVNLEVWKGIAE
ncbi:winged helix DNA-binding protein [Macrococcus capreoli]|uniref:transcriptional regulator, SarA/Rot family n=1 Tax=Macrococcus capreoli TaxID=2982690 RepID=UPI0021D5EF5A|nr:winged helix DNA-binding protein [Macrococcus sp. TMW 2.2395]MCU7558571.1 winged helix DNA-binding protein [Macrococcus sp. TMW 2.2395]